MLLLLLLLVAADAGVLASVAIQAANDVVDVGAGLRC